MSGRLLLPLQGVFTALVTPFDAAGNVDSIAFQALVAQQVAAGVAGLVVCGTTGEGPTITTAERFTLVSIAMAAVVGTSIRVIVGCGGNSTVETVANVQACKLLGVHAVLVVVPYYNKPSQAGIIAHFQAVNTVEVPIILYNVPSRTAVNMLPATTVTIYNTCMSVVGIKECASVEAMGEIKYLSPSLPVLAGDDAWTVPGMSVGASGVVSVISNLIPVDVVDMVNKMLSLDIAGARTRQISMARIIKDLFIETNPACIKRYLQLTSRPGASAGGLRLPLTAVTPSSPTDVELTAALVAYGIL